MTDDIPELTAAQLARAIPASLRRRLMAGDIRSGDDPGLQPGGTQDKTQASDCPTLPGDLGTASHPPRYAALISSFCASSAEGPLMAISPVRSTYAR